jgi:hypothetical protein
MGWVKIDDNFANHPKVLKAGPLGIAMQVAALCYCNHYLTDGFIPASAVPGLLNLNGLGMRMWAGELMGGGEDATWEFIVEDLLNAGLWHEIDGGYQIHDYLDYQPSKEKVIADRNATAARVKRFRETSNTVSNDNVTPLQTSYNGVSNTSPVPVPDPLKDIKDNALSPEATPLYQKIINLYHNECPSLPKVRALTDSRRKVIQARWKEKKTIEPFAEVFKKAEASDFLSGRNGRWTACNFDWLLKPTNFQKTLEGIHDNRAGPKASSPPVDNAFQFEPWELDPEFKRQVKEREERDAAERLAKIRARTERAAEPG